MSLINDALRRAKQAQREVESTPAAPVPQFRTIEPTPQKARHSLGVMLPVSLGLVALLALLFIWELAKRDTSVAATQAKAPVNVAARVPSSSDAGQPANEVQASSTFVADGNSPAAS